MSEALVGDLCGGVRKNKVGVTKKIVGVPMDVRLGSPKNSRALSEEDDASDEKME